MSREIAAVTLIGFSLVVLLSVAFGTPPPDVSRDEGIRMDVSVPLATLSREVTVSSDTVTLDVGDQAARCYLTVHGDFHPVRSSVVDVYCWNFEGSRSSDSLLLLVTRKGDCSAQIALRSELRATPLPAGQSAMRVPGITVTSPPVYGNEEMASGTAHYALAAATADDGSTPSTRRAGVDSEGSYQRAPEAPDDLTWSCSMTSRLTHQFDDGTGTLPTVESALPAAYADYAESWSPTANELVFLAIGALLGPLWGAIATLYPRKKV